MNRSTVWLRHGGAADQTYVLIRGWLAFIAAFDWRRDNAESARFATER